jgi:hypothetical protein
MEQLSKKVYLGNNTGNYIVDFNIKKYVIEYLKKYLPEPSKKMDNLLDLHYVKNNPYVFIPYFSMNSYYLLFIHHANYYLSVLIEKNSICDNINYNNLKIFHVRLRGNKTLYSGTLFDGNLIKIDNKSIFLIRNLYVIQGKEIKDNYLTKIKMIDNILNSIHTDKLYDTFELKVTRYYKINQKDLEEFKNKLPTTKLPISGMEFISVNQDTLNYYNEFDIKKNIENEMKIFKINKLNIPDVYELYCMQHNNIYKYGIAYISSLEKSKQINSLFNNKDTLIMECSYNKKFNKWEPIHSSNKDLSDYNDVVASIKKII